MANSDIIVKGDDGFYHPTDEPQIIGLVKKAYEEGLQIRCRGAAHSIAWAIYTDPGQGDPPIPNKVSEQFPPEGPNLNVMLDKYIKLTWIDEKEGIIEVEAGIHLGDDPEDPTDTSTLKDSLLYQAFEKGWALNDLGGITHQTVSGFLSTGSSGGSLTYDLEENILAFRVIDGTGKAEWIEKAGNEELFNAMGVSMGLLGIITKVRLKLTPNFYIYGQQITTQTDIEDCPIDLFGSGQDGKPSLETFLVETPYTRILWWPQKKVERIVTWQAVRGKALPVFDPIPYEQFAKTPFGTQLEQILGAILFTLLGNRGVFKVWRKLRKDFKQFKNNIKPLKGRVRATLWTASIRCVAWCLVLFFGIFKPLLIWLYPTIISLLQPLTKDGEANVFMDYMWRSLPMDNEADDILLGTEFTEMWIPLSKTERVMQLLRDHFVENGYDATGFYSTELYTGYKSTFWLSPSYNEDMFRVDIFWYINNEGDPAAKDGFFRQFWELLRDNDIPFRLHWGKFLPEYDFKEWAEYFKAQYPKWDDFMALRVERDPKNIFLTDYWRRQLFGEDVT